MKASLIIAASGIALTFGAAAVISTASTAQAPATSASPAPVVIQTQDDTYLDAAQSEGDWVYSDEGSERFAAFITPPDAMVFAMVCDNGEIEILRGTASEGSTMRVMSVTTETVTRQLQAQEVPNRPMVTTTLDARDPLFDAMAITKGRFAVEVEGEDTLYLPAWAEVSRIIEDCR